MESIKRHEEYAESRRKAVKEDLKNLKDEYQFFVEKRHSVDGEKSKKQNEIRENESAVCIFIS